MNIRHWSSAVLERVAHVVHHCGPVAGMMLTKDPHARIPGRVVAVRHPAPVRLSVEQQPHGNTERASQVSRHRVHGDHEVEQSNAYRQLIDFTAGDWSGWKRAGCGRILQAEP